MAHGARRMAEDQMQQRAESKAQRAKGKASACAARGRTYWFLAFRVPCAVYRAPLFMNT